MFARYAALIKYPTLLSILSCTVCSCLQDATTLVLLCIVLSEHGMSQPPWCIGAMVHVITLVTLVGYFLDDARQKRKKTARWPGKKNPATLVFHCGRTIHKTVAGFCRKNCVWRVSAVSNVWVAGNI